MDEGKEPAVPDRAGLGRVYKATQYVERLTRNSLGEDESLAPPLQIRYAKTTSTVSARSTNTLGTGHADFYHDEDGILTAESPVFNVDVVNWSGTSIASGKWILIAVIGGKWAVIAADC